MTERSKESLFDRLLKSRYPLTHYLGRQQQFLALFPAASIPSEGETNAVRQPKTPYPSSSKVEIYDTSNGMISDQDYNTAQDRSSETDDDARPVSKSIMKKATLN